MSHRALLALLILLIPSIPVAGQTPEAESRTQELTAIAARELTRIGLMDFRMQASPTPDDLSLLDGVLEIVQHLRPDHEATIRRRIDIAYRLGDTAAIDARTRDLLRLDPNDSVAALRLITLHIGRLQTSQERLSAYARYLGPAGARLDPAIRSRLALDAAVLSNEGGNEQAFTRYLT